MDQLFLRERDTHTDRDYERGPSQPRRCSSSYGSVISPWRKHSHKNKMQGLANEVWARQDSVRPCMGQSFFYLMKGTHLNWLACGLRAPKCSCSFGSAVFFVHPQNVRFQNVRFQNVRFQNVWNVRVTKRQLYKTSGLQNVRFTKRQVFKTSGCKKNNHVYSVLVVGGNLQVLLQPCWQAKWWLCFILYFRGLFCHISP